MGRLVESNHGQVQTERFELVQDQGQEVGHLRLSPGGEHLHIAAQAFLVKAFRPPSFEPIELHGPVRFECLHSDDLGKGQAARIRQQAVARRASPWRQTLS